MADEETNEGQVQVDAIVAAVKAAIQPDLEAIKSSTDSRLDTLKNDVTSLASSRPATPSTEVGKKVEDVAGRLQQEKIEADIKATAESRDAFWQAKTEALYEKKLPAAAFEGFSTAAEIKRQTAVLESVMGLTNNENKQTNGGIGSGGAEPAAATHQSKTEAMAAYLDKRPITKPN